jgi:hypothetical protein
MYGSSEEVMRAACIMREAAERMERATSNMEAVIRPLLMQLEEGYGGTGPRLLGALERASKTVKA